MCLSSDCEEVENTWQHSNRMYPYMLTNMTRSYCTYPLDVVMSESSSHVQRDSRGVKSGAIYHMPKAKEGE